MSTNLKISNLLIGHHHQVLTEPIDLDLQQGDCLAVLGRNGAGKSTLLHTICKFIPSLGGSIEINGMDISRMSHRELALHVSIVMAGRREVVPQISVEEILKLGRFPYTGFYSKLSDQDKKVIEDVISLLGLGPLRYKLISELSDGESQKVFIARALVQDTSIIIFDEPTTHLDLFNRHDIFNIIQSLTGRDKIILLSTHEIRPALGIANKCILFGENGRVITGTTDQLEKEQVIESYFGELIER